MSSEKLFPGRTPVQAQPVAPAPSALARAVAGNQPKEGYRGSALDFTADVIRADFAQSALARLFSQSGYPTDENWKIPYRDSDEGKELWEGIDRADEGYFLHARSKAHFQKLKDDYLEVKAAEKRLAEAGGAGIAARLALNVLDPVGILMAAGTGRLELLAKGGRLARGVKVGLLNAGANAAFEGVVGATNPTHDTTDLLTAAVFGYSLGHFSGALSRKEVDLARITTNKVLRRAHAEEIVEEAAKDGVTLNVDEVDEILSQGVPQRKPKMKTETATPKAPRTVSVSMPSSFRAYLRQVEGGAQASPLRDRLIKTLDETDSDTLDIDEELYDYLGSRLDEIADDLHAKKLAASAGEVELPAHPQILQRAAQRLKDEYLEDVGMRKIMADQQTAKITNEEEIDLAAFGGDSVGAARASMARDVLDTEDLEFVHGGKVDRTAFAKAQVWSYSAVLRGASDDVVRSTLGLLVGDPVGTASGRVTQIGASEEASRLHKIYAGRLVQMDNEAMDEFLKDTAKQRGTIANMTARFNPRLRDEFMRQVGRAMMGMPGEYHPAVTKLAAKKKALLDEIGDELVNLGIIESKADKYNLPRFWDHEAIETANLRYHTDQLETLFTTAIRRDFLGQSILNSGLDPERAEEIIKRIGKGFLKRIREVGRGIDVEMMHGVSLQDSKYLDELLEQGGASDELRKYVNDNFQWMLKQKHKDDAVKPSFGKHRMKLDMDFGMRLKVMDQDSPDYGQMVMVRIGDLVEQNAELILHRYLRGTTGRIAIAKILGVKNDGEFTKLVNAAKSRLQNENEQQRVARYAQDAYNALVGRPLDENPNSALNRFSRAMRNLNMARLGSSFGIAQLADLANVTAIGGFREMLGGVAEFRRFFARAANGRLEDSLLRDLEEFAALGMDHRSTTLFAHDYDEILYSRLGKIEFGLRAASRAAAVSSGMTLINRWSQLLAGRMILNKLARGRINAKRLSYLGLSKEDADAIVAAIRQHGSIKNGRVESLNLSNWPDMVLRDKLVRAVRKGATRAVQENDFGSTFPFMHRELGKMFSQFRSFVLSAWSKQTLHLLHMRDDEALANLMWGLFFGPLSYAAYVTASHPREEWGERLSFGKVASASLTRTGFGSMIPTLVDTPLDVLGFNPVFAHGRSTQLSTSAIAGIPTIDFALRSKRAIGDLVQAGLGNEEYTQRDFDNLMRLSILQNFWGVPWLRRQASEALDLPEE